MLQTFINKLTDALGWMFDDPSDAIRLARIIAIALPVGVLGAGTSIYYGMWLRAVISLVGVPVLAMAGFAAIQGFSGAVGGLYHSGSHQLNHAALTKGMYNLAAGYVKSGQFAQARDKYLEILETYPEELDARYLLANLWDQHFGLQEEALKEFMRLRRMIKEKNVDYKYQRALEERIEELQKFLEEEKKDPPKGGR